MAKRILLVNKFYYSRGGAEVVTINLYNELTSRGYDVAVFTMDYHSMIREHKVYTVPEVTFKEGFGQQINFARRTLGDYGVKQAFKHALDDFKPDVVHLQNIHSYISPAVAQLAKERGCRVVWTMHDYKLICPAYSCLNQGVPCEKCYSHKHKILSERCFKNSFSASALAFVEAKKWNRRKLEKLVDAFVCPSNFMRNQMIKGGFSPSRLYVVNNFIDPIKARELKRGVVTEKGGYYTYIGRLSEEKGVETLLKAAQHLPYTLKIGGNGPLREYFETNYSADNIEFLGQLDAVEVSEVMRNANVLIQPSECYENNPLSTIEALCAGTPVIGSDMGGIPELINEDNGMIYAANDEIALEQCIRRVMEQDGYDYHAIARAARERFGADRHIEKLEKLYFGGR